MAQTVVDMKCPGCGNPVSTADRECKYCGRPVVITTFHSICGMPAPQIGKYIGEYGKVLSADPGNTEINGGIAMCYLKIGLYDKALEAFEKAMENNFGNSEIFFFAAVCLLRGKKAFNTPFADIKKAIEYTNAAIAIEPRGIYFYFLAYLKYDFYERKCLNIRPDYKEELKAAVSSRVSGEDIRLLFDVIGKPVPEPIALRATR